ncbi:MAG: SbcC/MukB-like Walker B domain-containing protein, partial [Desulfobulbaceae bacterium]|nr:SbcC/MukB-like Walker B domain-containing protein [Desulfobulbaceae bacterium]
LSDRYLLRRHQDEELGLEIIDTYQADAIRPTGTLSGGEEFLVSLALALGLARLSGQSRIDSLFLDEGFGTLDTETLETALSALSALHETGKTIGVISHVDALKERIPVQIRLRRLAGGYSNLSVVG